MPTSSSTPRFDDVLLLAEGIGRHRAHVFEIQLPAAQGRRTLQGLCNPRLALGNALMGFEETINGAARRHRERLGFLLGLPVQVVGNGFGARNPSQALGRCIADAEDALHHGGRRRGRRMDAGPPMALQDLLQGEVSSHLLPKACAPFLDPLARTSQGGSQLLMGPLWMHLLETRQVSSFSIV